MTERELLEEITQIHSIDTHTHFESYTETFGYTMPQFLYNCSYAGVFGGYFSNGDIRLMETSGQDEEKQYEALLRIREKLGVMRCGRLLDDIAKRLGAELKRENFHELSEAYKRRTEEQIRALTPTIDGFICNSIGHPLYGGIAGLKKYIDAPMNLDAKMHRILNITGLHSITSLEGLKELELVSGQEIGNLQDWEKACAYVIRRFAAQGIVGYKDVYLYFRPAKIDIPDASRACAEFGRFLKGEAAGKAMLDFMMFKLYEILSDTKLAVAVHTGAVIKTSETAASFTDYMKILKAFPAINFDLLHLNYPLLDLYLMILRSCPNAYGNAAWITSNNTEYTLRYMEEAIDCIPADRTNFFGTDRHCAGEAVAAVLKQTQELLASGLYRMAKAGRLSGQEARKLAEMWMYQNPRRLYGI